MISLPGIVLVDDKKEDLDAIQNSFTCAGYPCFPIHYRNDEPSNVTGIDHVNLRMLNSRVIITDLNLQELQVDATQLVGPIAEVLQKLATEGPYVLYFWSKNASTVTEVMELIETRYSEAVHYPLHWGILDKAHYKNRPDELIDKVTGLFAENPVFNALFGWENRVSTSAQRTTDSLFKLAIPLESTGIADFQSLVTTKLQTMLAVIGNEAIGQKNAKDEPEVAVELGLEPVLHDQLNSNSNELGHASWQSAAPEIGEAVNIKPELATKLNSFYHIEQVETEYSKACRGVFLEIDGRVLNDTKKREKLETRLGIKLNDLINEEFLAQIVKKNNIETVSKATKLGFIEVSAECDQAQQKTKLHRYILAALTPLKYEEFIIFGKQGKKSHSGIYRAPDINIGEVDYMLQLSFKYQIGSIPSENTWLGCAKFRLRDQIMTDISFSCAQYVSRPGIITFK
ncbi:MAG: hypothetical protein ACI9FB_003162 [Candidatus Azotimanducaceae bacterium]|jgi:hypothetical protein